MQGLLDEPNIEDPANECYRDFKRNRPQYDKWAWSRARNRLRWFVESRLRKLKHVYAALQDGEAANKAICSRLAGAGGCR